MIQFNKQFQYLLCVNDLCIYLYKLWLSLSVVSTIISTTTKQKSVKRNENEIWAVNKKNKKQIEAKNQLWTKYFCASFPIKL